MNDLVGVTVVFITCSYRETDFIRIGYVPDPPCRVAGAIAFRRFHSRVRVRGSFPGSCGLTM